MHERDFLAEAEAELACLDEYKAIESPHKTPQWYTSFLLPQIRVALAAPFKCAFWLLTEHTGKMFLAATFCYIVYANETAKSSRALSSAQHTESRESAEHPLGTVDARAAPRQEQVHPWPEVERAIRYHEPNYVWFAGENCFKAGIHTNTTVERDQDGVTLLVNGADYVFRVVSVHADPSSKDRLKLYSFLVETVGSRRTSVRFYASRAACLLARQKAPEPPADNPKTPPTEVKKTTGKRAKQSRNTRTDVAEVQSRNTRTVVAEEIDYDDADAP